MKKIKIFTNGSHFYSVCIILDTREVIVKYYAVAGSYVNEIKDFPEDESSIGFVALNKLYSQIKNWASRKGFKLLNLLNI